MVQKTDTIEKQKTSTEDTVKTRNEPPSWSELSKKSNASKTIRNATLLSIAALAAGLLFPVPGSWGFAVFLTVLLGSVLGFGDAKSGALSGAFVLGLTSFFGSILLSIVSLGTMTIFPSIVIGLLIGGIAGYVGKKAF